MTATVNKALLNLSRIIDQNLLFCSTVHSEVINPGAFKIVEISM